MFVKILFDVKREFINVSMLKGFLQGGGHVRVFVCNVLVRGEWGLGSVCGTKSP